MNRPKWNKMVWRRLYTCVCSYQGVNFSVEEALEGNAKMVPADAIEEVGECRQMPWCPKSISNPLCLGTEPQIHSRLTDTFCSNHCFGRETHLLCAHPTWFVIGDSSKNVPIPTFECAKFSSYMFGDPGKSLREELADITRLRQIGEWFAFSRKRHGHHHHRYRHHPIASPQLLYGHPCRPPLSAHVEALRRTRQVC